MATSVLLPQSFGDDAYPSIEQKAAALLHSLARNQALVNGNKRSDPRGNGGVPRRERRRLTLSNDGAFELVMSVATSEVDDVTAIAESLTTEPVPFWRVSPPPT